MAALLAPLGVCAEYLDDGVVEPMLCAGMGKAVKFVQGLEANELKEKVRYISHESSLSLSTHSQVPQNVGKCVMTRDPILTFVDIS